MFRKNSLFANLYFLMFYVLKNFLYKIYYTLFSHFVLYPLVSLLPKHFDVKFMNLGYVPLENSKDKSIEDLADQYLNFQDPIRPHCLLYEKTLSLCSKYPLFSEQTKLLEVGCGLGGGLQWLKIAHEQLSETVGMDPIVSSRSKHDNMVKGSAEKIPFTAKTFDIVLNVESSHLYLDQRKFFAEASRVLKFGGYLCWADLRHKDKMEDVLMDAKECGLNLVDFEEINSQIIEGIHQTSARYEKCLKMLPGLSVYLRTHLSMYTVHPAQIHITNMWMEREPTLWLVGKKILNEISVSHIF